MKFERCSRPQFFNPAVICRGCGGQDVAAMVFWPLERNGRDNPKKNYARIERECKCGRRWDEAPISISGGLV